MTDLNSISLIGRCVRDISNNDFAYTPNGKARLTFSIAVNRSRKQGDQWIDEVSYIDCLVWGAFAETLKQKLHKGMRVRLPVQSDRTDGRIITAIIEVRYMLLLIVFRIWKAV